MYADNSDFAQTQVKTGWSQKRLSDAGVWLADVPAFNVGVVFFSIGIALYFGFGFEPDIRLVALTIGLLAALCWAFRARVGFAPLCLMLLIFLGVGRSAWHSAAVATPNLPNYERTYRIQGWISDVERSGRGERYVVEIADIRGFSAAEQPKRLRIRVTKAAEPPLRAGDTLNWLVSAKAPPGAAVPGGYDPGRAAYFKGIGGFGFAYGAPERETDLTLGRWDDLRRCVARWRNGLADRVMDAAPEDTAGLQAALMTGVRRHIPPEQTESLRIAGLAHILAISGLHMGLLAGGTFTFATFLLACILPLSRRYDIRKPAAGIGILAATTYLVLSGASVATQRAWVMAVIVFLAVILDRRAVSMRSVCVAALITLTLHPESLVSVGFQMSFAAVAALVATYQFWQRYRPAFAPANRRRRTLNFFTSLSVTSLVAGFATAGFALFHFNRFARYGFAGNLLAMPLFSLAVMPLAVIALLAMPFGWESAPLWLMGKALEPILLASDWVAGWPGSLDYVPAAPDWVLPLYAIGFCALCMGKSGWRAFGFVTILIAFAGWRQMDAPSLRVSESGQVAFWSVPEDGEGAPVLLVGSKRSDRYGREQFARRAGSPEAEWESYAKTIATCDALACRARVGAWQISVLQAPSEVEAECAVSDLVILAVRSAGPVARRGCEAVLIDETSLRDTGALDVYLRDTLTIKAARPAKAKRRPWHFQ